MKGMRNTFGVALNEDDLQESFARANITNRTRALSPFVPVKNTKQSAIARAIARAMDIKVAADVMRARREVNLLNKILMVTVYKHLEGDVIPDVLRLSVEKRYRGDYPS